MNEIYYADLETRIEKFASKEPTATLFEDGRVVTSKVYELDKEKFSLKGLNLNWT